MDQQTHSASHGPDGRPDAVLMPSSLKTGRRLLDRVGSVLDIAEPLLQVDRSAGERAWIRQQPNNRLFVTRDPHDTIFFRTITRGPVSSGTTGGRARAVRISTWVPGRRGGH